MFGLFLLLLWYDMIRILACVCVYVCMCACVVVILAFLLLFLLSVVLSSCTMRYPYFSFLRQSWRWPRWWHYNDDDDDAVEAHGGGNQGGVELSGVPHHGDRGAERLDDCVGPQAEKTVVRVTGQQPGARDRHRLEPGAGSAPRDR